jgi:phenylpropionate dioxygenase-like ring-hydroxylating dioxygenase large terminal subunit
VTYIKDDWYVAAWPEEITEKPISRRLGGNPVVLYRDRDGKALAFLDRCPHRGAPLSFGEVTDLGLQCNYHGITFGSDGKACRIPGQDRIPPKAVVRSFPIVERDGFIWIWLGDPAKADPDKIVDYSYHNDPKNWPSKKGYKQVGAHYMHLVDNLMDLTHIGFMHKATIGSGPADAYANPIIKIERTDTGVKFVRWLLDHVPPATYVAAVGFKGLVDRWQEFEFVGPGNVLQYTGATDAGTGAYDQGKRDGGIQIRIFHALTPETDTSCHYFFSTMNGYRLDDPSATEQLHEQISVTFEEDKMFCEGQQARLDEFPEPQVDYKLDNVRIQGRRYYELRMAEQESAEMDELVSQEAAR